MKNAIAAILAASLLTAHASELSASTADQNWVRLIPAGTFAGRDGRGPYQAGDRAALEQIAALTRQYHGATDIVFDYEHQTLQAVENGKPAPAAGWIKEIEARDDGLYGRVEWTSAAAAAIAAKEYRYLSPVFFHKPDGEVLALQNVALTNSPNLNLLEVSAHSIFSSAHNREVSMKRVLALLGLSEGGSEDDVLVAINSLLTSSTAIAAAAGLTKDAKSEEIVAKVSAMRSTATATPDPTKFVPIAAFEEVQAQVTGLVARQVDTDAETAVADAMRAGKITPAQKDWAISLHKADKAKFEQFLGSAPVLTATQRSSAVPPKADGPTAGLDDADLAVMRQMGLSAEDMKKSKEALEAAR